MEQLVKLDSQFNTLEQLHQVPSIGHFFLEEEVAAGEDGGLYGPSSPAPPLGLTETSTDSGGATACPAGLRVAAADQ
jgi:hypothetical protein